MFDNLIISKVFITCDVWNKVLTYIIKDCELSRSEHVLVW
jgi:hypothetical protein